MVGRRGIAGSGQLFPNISGEWGHRDPNPWGKSILLPAGHPPATWGGCQARRGMYVLFLVAGRAIPAEGYWRSLLGGQMDEQRQIGPESRLKRLRVLASRYVGDIGIALIALTAIVLAYTWFRAQQTGRVPPEWGIHQGNHGPWRRNELGEGVRLAWNLPLAGAVIALASAAIWPSKRSVVIAAIGFGIGLLVLFTHLWLVD